VVSPFMDPGFWPSISSALRMSCFVIGQFGIRSFSILMHLVVGLPIMSCIECVLQSFAYSLTMCLFLIESIVLIMKYAMLFFNMRERKPFLEGMKHG